MRENVLVFVCYTLQDSACRLWALQTSLFTRGLSGKNYDFWWFGNFEEERLLDEQGAACRLVWGVQAVPFKTQPNFPRDTRVRVTVVARPLLTPVAQSCAGANVVYSWTKRVFILDITSHRNGLLLFVKQLAMCILTAGRPLGRGEWGGTYRLPTSFLFPFFLSFFLVYRYRNLKEGPRIDCFAPGPAPSTDVSAWQEHTE
jgi:hypothetical protein